MLENFKLPDISNNQLSDARERRQILEYLYQLTEQLRFILENLDADNFTEDFKESIENTGAVEKLEQKVEDAQNGLVSLRRQTADGFEQTVRKNGIISAINQSAEMIQIIANRIRLEGYVTINGTFSIDEQGYLRCSGGTIGAFSVDANGGLMGMAPLKIGNMMIQGSAIQGMTHAPNLVIGTQNFDLQAYPGMGGQVSMMGVSQFGQMLLSDLYIIDHMTGQQAARYSLAKAPPGAVPPKPPMQTVEVIQINTLGHGRPKKYEAWDGSLSWGICQAGEIYRHAGVVLGRDGMMWARCVSKFNYNQTMDTWAEVPEEPFYFKYEVGDGRFFYDYSTITL